MWCWRRLLRVPWTARILNQSILKEINPEYSLEGLMKLQYFGCLMWRGKDSLEKTLMLGKIEGKRGRGQQWMRWLDRITDSMDMNLSGGHCESWTASGQESGPETHLEVRTGSLDWLILCLQRWFNDCSNSSQRCSTHDSLPMLWAPGTCEDRLVPWSYPPCPLRS